MCELLSVSANQGELRRELAHVVVWHALGLALRSWRQSGDRDSRIASNYYGRQIQGRARQQRGEFLLQLPIA